MTQRLLLFFIFSAVLGNAQIQFNEQQTSNFKLDLGTINEASEIKGDILIKNIGNKKMFFLRADADRGVKVFTTKKALQPNDTCLIEISFIPETKGRFEKKINLVTSDQTTPYKIVLTGNLKTLKANDKTACYYFGRKRNNSTAVKEIPISITESNEQRDNTNRLPDAAAISYTLISPQIKNEKKNTAELSITEYKPNNIIFLIDISGSMKDSLKLPLMKNALRTLIDATREVDHITIVTYADTVIVLQDAMKGSEKQQLNRVIDGLKAHGLTKARKAILFSQLLAQKNFIAGGNNQIILASDGEFNFSEKDFRTWTQQQKDKKIVMSVVVFGNDKKAVKNLEEIADKCEGSFIHVRKRNGSKEVLLEEIKERSKIK
jgi:Mg-chelatase subunit ChlD